MKKMTLADRPVARLLALLLTLGANAATPIATPTARGADDDQKPPTLVEKWKQWQDQLWEKLHHPSKTRRETKNEQPLPKEAPRKSAGPGAASEDAWERDLQSHFDKMQAEMDRMFEDSFRDFGLKPDLARFMNNHGPGGSFDLQDEGDHYVVRARFPDPKNTKLSISAEGQTLKIEATTEGGGDPHDKGAVETERAISSEEITLPGPFKLDKMKLDKSNGTVSITLPKG